MRLKNYKGNVEIPGKREFGNLGIRFLREFVKDGIRDKSSVSRLKFRGIGMPFLSVETGRDM